MDTANAPTETGSFARGMVMSTFDVDNSAVQAVWDNIDVSAIPNPHIISQAACGPVAPCSMFVEVNVRDTATQGVLEVWNVTEDADGQADGIDIDLTPHKGEPLTVVFFMLNNTAEAGDIVVFDDPRILGL